MQNRAHHILCSMLLLFFLCLQEEKAAAQLHYYSLQVKDSLTADEQTPILYNQVRITNLRNKTLHIGLSLSIPSGWKLLSATDSLSTLTLAPGQTRNLPLNLLRTASASVFWQEAIISSWIQYGSDTLRTPCRLRVKVRPRLQARPLTEDQYFLRNPDTIHTGVYFRNAGNTTEAYTLQWQNQLLGFNDSLRVQLAPGRDTYCHHTLRLHKAAWEQLHQEDIGFVIRGSNGSGFAHNYRVSRARSNIRENRSKYDVVPVTLEAGAIRLGDIVNYYGGARGMIRFGDNHDLNFYYRSKQFGTEINAFQQHIYNIDYHYHRWRLGIGQTGSQSYFLTYGRGASLCYEWNERKKIGIAGVLHDPLFAYKSDNVSAFVRYPVGKTTWHHELIANFDNTSTLYSYITANNVRLFDSKEFRLSLQADAGMDHKTRNLPGVRRATAGLAAGYTLSWSRKSWEVYSNIQYYGSEFPGINKGLHLQTHQLTWKQGNFFAGPFCAYNYLLRNYFRDSLYNSDVLSYNTTRYGLRAGITNAKVNLSVNAGLMAQNGQFLYHLKNYQFADLYYNWIIGRTTTLNIFSQTAFARDTGLVRKYVLLNTTTASFSTRYGGFSGIYTRVPVQGNEVTGRNGYEETVNLSPYLNFYFFRNKLCGSIRYNISKAIADNTFSDGVGGSLSYNDARAGLRVQLNTFVPLRMRSSLGYLPLQNRDYATLTVTKQLFVPILTRRKNYELELALFADTNHNNRKDQGEPALANAQVLINNTPFVTDADGRIRYRNIPKGAYALCMAGTQQPGLIPADGAEREVLLEKDVQTEIAFKKGKIIRGSIRIVSDSFSHTRLTPDNIRVTATDSHARSYSTLTDDSGHFVFYVPEGKYKVALNPNAFADTDFKPVQLERDADLVSDPECSVAFEIRQKKRKVRFVTDKGGTKTP